MKMPKDLKAIRNEHVSKSAWALNYNDGFDHGANAVLDHEQIKKLISTAQGILTALNVGNIETGSLLHLELRKIMIDFRAWRGGE